MRELQWTRFDEARPTDEDMIQCAINWVLAKAYELPEEKRSNLVAILRYARADLAAERKLREELEAQVVALTYEAEPLTCSDSHNSDV